MTQSPVLFDMEVWYFEVWSWSFVFASEIISLSIAIQREVQLIEPPDLLSQN